jgi:hypothetical protein
MALGENPRKMILHCTNQIKVSEAYSDENGDGFRKICLSYTPPPIDFLQYNPALLVAVLPDGRPAKNRAAKYVNR